MGKIGHGYGSEWHLLGHLGYHRNYFSEQIIRVTGGKGITWLDFGFPKTKSPSKLDKELVGLEFIDDEAVRNKWQSFWPPSGTSQNWDAVGKIHFENHDEWLLVEAKAHLNEVNSRCGATNLKSIGIINSALEKTASSLTHSSTPTEKWLTPYYQYANRLAALYFLMKECHPVIPARLLFIYFYGDSRNGVKCPQSPLDWEPVISKVENHLSIDPNSALYKRIHRIFLPVYPGEVSS